MSTLSVGSLFSGIGGMDLGLERAGMRVIWQSEIDPYASRVLAKHWPDIPNLGDIRNIDWSTVERPDLICGGYPCQPFSLAGGRAGTDDPRHLWPYFADALRHLRPRWALLENVPGHLTLGFDEVLADLASLGFDAEWELLPAAAFGAPHLRYRLFVVAYANGQGEHDGPIDAEVAGAPQPFPDANCKELRNQPVVELRSGGASVVGDDGPQGFVADTHRPGLPVFEGGGSFAECQGVGTPGDTGWWSSEPDVGRVANGFPPGLDRVARLRSLGNAVVPQVAEYVGRCIVNANA